MYERAQTKPNSILKALKVFHGKHPLPEVYNLLSYVYISLKKIKKAEKIIEENYKQHPDNLFARVNYGDQCLRRKQVNKFTEIFENKFTLQELYPKQKTFHCSEILGFIGLIGLYYFTINKKNLAEAYYFYGKIIDPNDKTIKFLEKKLYKKTFFQKTWGRITGYNK